MLFLIAAARKGANGYCCFVGSTGRLFCRPTTQTVSSLEVINRSPEHTPNQPEQLDMHQRKTGTPPLATSEMSTPFLPKTKTTHELTLNFRQQLTTAPRSPTPLQKHPPPGSPPPRHP